MAMMVQADYEPVKAGRLSIGKDDMIEATKAVGDGISVGIYRDNEKKVPVLLKSDVSGRDESRSFGRSCRVERGTFGTIGTGDKGYMYRVGISIGSYL